MNTYLVTSVPGPYSHHYEQGGSENVTLNYRVWYEGEWLVNGSTSIPRDSLTTLESLEIAGSAKSQFAQKVTGRQKIVVLYDPEKEIFIQIDAQGHVSEITPRTGQPGN